MDEKVPVYVVSGFLGAGKTTFINQLLSQTAGYKVGILVNDFGDINIDATLVEKQVDELVSLSNGCLCCSLSNELDDSLNQLTNAKSDLDLIIVEASGVADPKQMAGLIINSENKHIYFKDIVYLLDAVNFKSFWRDHERQARLGLAISKIVLLNKIDLAGPEQVAEIESLIREVSPESLIIPTTNAKLDYRILLDQKDRFETQLKIGQSEYHHEHNHTKYETFSFTEPRPLDPIKTTAVLNNLPAGVYRAKGWLNFGDKAKGYKLLLQIVGKQHKLSAIPWDKDDKRETNLVFIGTGINAKSLHQKLTKLVDASPNTITDENRVSVEYFI